MLDTPYIVRQTATTNTSTAVDVSAPKLIAGQLVEVKHVALANNSGENVAVQFGVIVPGGTFIPITAKTTAVADADAVSLLTDFYLRDGEALNARVTGSANKSSVTLIVSGEFVTLSAIANKLDAPAPVVTA